MKSREEIMEILETFDLTNAFRPAGDLAGCSPDAVKHWVAQHDTGASPVPNEPARRDRSPTRSSTRSSGRRAASAPMSASTSCGR
jgi:hypothetical protein